MSITRRHFLRNSLGIIGAVIAAGAMPPALRYLIPPLRRNSTKASALAPASEIRSGDWTQSTVADFRQGELDGIVIEERGDGELALASDSRSGVYTSPVFAAAFPFNAVGARWRAEISGEASLEVEVRTRPQDGPWSPWREMTVLDGLKGGSFPITNLLFTEGLATELQCRVVMARPSAYPSPRLHAITLTYIDSTRSPSLAEAKTKAIVAPMAGAVAKPPVIPRVGWGADESYRFSGGKEVWPPQYEYVTAAIIHHTVTDNATDPVAAVNAIYYYHAVKLGWGDMGYNYLVDRFGNIYEGRYGGDNVMAGHALQYNKGSLGVAALGTYDSVAPSSQLEASLTSLAAWQAYNTGIDPNGTTYLVDKTVPCLMGHRDALSTTCPGDRLYVDIPSVRTGVWAKLPDYGQAWRSSQVPGSANQGDTFNVSVTLRNAGRKVWVSGGANPFRLGYRWFDAAGNELKDGTAQRIALPSDVAPGKQVSLAGVVKTPAAAGALSLQFDMVEEWITWFSQHGNATLNTTVNVQGPKYGEAWGPHETPTKMAPGETVTVKVEVTNTGSLTWTTAWPSPFRLGYHWYDSSGNQYVQPPEDDHRTLPPKAVAPGEKVTIDAKLTAPKDNGSYTLKWDMVHEGVTWFASPPYNNKTLDVAINVSPPVLNVTPATLSFEKLSDAAVPAQELKIANDGGGLMSWTATTASEWLALSAPSGKTPATLSVSVKTDGLAPGSYSGKIVVTGSVQGLAPLIKEVPVSLALGGLVATPATLLFTVRGQIIPQPQKLEITSLAGPTDWRAEAGAAWIKLGANSGQTPSSIEVGVDPFAIPAGIHSSEIRIYNTTTNSPTPLTVPVGLSIPGGWQRLYLPFVIDQKVGP